MKSDFSQRGAVAWSIPDLARAIGVPRSSLYDAIRRGDGPRTRRLGRRYMVLADDVVAWLGALPLVGRQLSPGPTEAERYQAACAQRSSPLGFGKRRQS